MSVSRCLLSVLLLSCVAGAQGRGLSFVFRSIQAGKACESPYVAGRLFFSGGLRAKKVSVVAAVAHVDGRGVYVADFQSVKVAVGSDGKFFLSLLPLRAEKWIALLLVSSEKGIDGRTLIVTPVSCVHVDVYLGPFS
jgi:hypothetical protein